MDPMKLPANPFYPTGFPLPHLPLRLALSLTSSLALLLILLPATLLAQPTLPPGATVEKVASDFGFAEGPSADGAGGILFVDIDRGGTRNRPGRILRYDIATDSVTAVVNEAKTIAGDAGTIGVARKADGTVVLARGDQRQLAKLEGNTITTLADRWNGNIFNGPNDLVGDSLGGIYFTDPNFLGGTTVPEAVYYYSPAGSVSRVATGLNGPNGIGLSPDGDTLYVAAGRETKVWSFEVGTGGALSNKSLFANTRTDGMTVDFLGNVYLTDRGGKVRVFDPTGAPHFVITVPEHITNLTFADDRQTLYITGSENLYRVPVNVPEPSSIALALLGVGSLLLWKRRAT